MRRGIAAICASRALSLAVTCLWAAGCGPASGPTVRLEIDAAVAVPGQLDQIVLTVIASDPSTHHTCAPITRTADLDDDSDFPLLVDIEKGDQYTAWVAFRVVGNLVGTSGGAPEEVFFQEGRAFWPSSGISPFEVVIDEGCLRRGCQDDQHCVDGGCVARIAESEAFEDESIHDPVSCFEEGAH